MWALEKRFVPPEEVIEGPLPEKALLPVWLALWAAMSASLMLLPAQPAAVYGILVVLACFLARLIAIDLRHLLLLDIYTLPLILAGIALTPLLGLQTWQMAITGALAGFGVSLLLAYFMAWWRHTQADMGGGDIKMMAALGAWVGLYDLPMILAIASFFSLGLAACLPKSNFIPFGPGLALGLWVGVCFQKNIDYLFLALFQLIQ